MVLFWYHTVRTIGVRCEWNAFGQDQSRRNEKFEYTDGSPFIALLFRGNST
jgi:hypothetical protein